MREGVEVARLPVIHTYTPISGGRKSRSTMPLDERAGKDIRQKTVHR